MSKPQHGAVTIVGVDGEPHVYGTLCGLLATDRTRFCTNAPVEVTCKKCRASLAFEMWQIRREEV
jgi:hypothetical protein